MASYISVGEPLNRSEEEALRQLRDDLPEGYLIIGNFELAVSQRRNTLEYDAVVIGDYGVWAVEIKGWSGKITGNNRRWKLRWGRVDNPFIRIETKAKALRDTLVRHIPEWPDELYCLSSVFLPERKVDVSEIVDDRSARLVTSGGVREMFVERASALCGGHVMVDDELKQLIVDRLVPRAFPLSRLPVIPNYDIRESLDSEGLPYREYLGAHKLLRARGRVRIKAYSFVRLTPPSRRQRLIARALRDMEALEKLGPNPYVARAHELIRDVDDELVFYIVLEYVGPETLYGWLDASESERTDDMWELAYHLHKGVSFMHECDVVHKNLHPGSIRLDPEGQVPIRIADFDFARMANFDSIDDDLPTELGEGAYRAPELWVDDATYDARADVFSLGAILYAMYRGERLVIGFQELLDPGAAWQRRLERVEDVELRAVLSRMLCVNPDGRDGALADALELLARRSGVKS